MAEERGPAVRIVDYDPARPQGMEGKESFMKEMERRALDRVESRPF